MKRNIVALIISLVILVFISSLVSSQEDMKVVDNSDFTNPQRPPAVFDHDTHNENAEIEDCNVCHHVFEDGKKVEDESSDDERCSDCHGNKSEDGKPSLTAAFHDRCKGCHQEQKKGPILCGQCHRDDETLE